MENLKRNVQMKFAELRNALYTRERLLLRQANVIIQQTKEHQLGRGTSEIREVKFLAELENELLMAIRNFGRFQLDNINLTMQDVYLKNEDYITPANDHETMYKCLEQTRENYIKVSEQETSLSSTPNQTIEQPESIVVDFSRNMSLIEHNAKHMNNSIINITLQEAKELIRQAKMRRETPIPPLNLEELDDEMESSIAEAVTSLGHSGSSKINNEQLSDEKKPSKSTSKKTSSNRLKPKITINNCNGTINLRNISNLTINCATEDSISAQIPITIPVQQTTQKMSTQNATESEIEIENGSGNGNGNGLVSNSTNSEKLEKKCNENSMTNVSEKSETVIETVMSSTEESEMSKKSSASSSNCSSTSSSRSQSKKQKINANQKSSSSQAYHGRLDYDERDCLESHAMTCDFYNRLLKEIKNSLRTKKSHANTKYFNAANIEQSNDESSTKDSERIPVLYPTGETNSNYSSHQSSAAKQTSLTSNTEGTSSQTGAGGRRLVLKNFENLRIVLEATSSDEENFHPVQIEQWLAEIISETDLEPMQNTEILEHSKIHNESN